jgi:transglutaminase-like putative cysteine protease
MTFRALDWLKRNLNLVLTLSAAACLAVALGELVRGATLSLLLPVALAGVICGWGLGASRLSAKQAWVGLVALGLPGVFLFVGGLFPKLWGFTLEALALVPQLWAWLSERTPVDIAPLLAVWSGMSAHAASVLLRTWTWSVALARGEGLIDPLAVALAWNLLLWLAGAWAGWEMRRKRRALSALTPGGALLALVVDYTRGEVGLVIVYLALLLTLMGVGKSQWRQLRWQQRKVDYADSVVFETLLMVGMVTTGLVLSAAGTPSISWRELLEELRKGEQPGGERVAESLGLEAPPNAASEEAYRSDGLPRQHLLDLPPELLKDVVLTVSTGELPPAPDGAFEGGAERYHWRALTYDIYTGAGWRSSAATESEVPAGTLLLELPVGYRALNQHIVRAPDGNASLYWTGLLARVDADVRIAWRTTPPEVAVPASNGDMLGALTSPDEYTVVSYVPATSAEELRGAGGDYPAEITRRYLRLPESLPERVLGLARQVTQASLTPYDRALAIESYLRQFPYTLEVGRPPAGRDVVDYFLFTEQRGYCDYYASAMVVLARAVGLPARLVIGYSSGEYDPARAEYIVRKENAHSWAEVYFPGYGWAEFEPTAGQPAIHELEDDSAAGPPPGVPAGQRALSWLQDRWRGLITSLSGQLLIGLTGLLVLVALWQAGEIGYLHLLPASHAIPRLYARLEKAASFLLSDLPCGHTPAQLGTALTQALKSPHERWSAAEGEIEQVVDLYVAQIFSPNTPERSQVRRGILAWSRLRWRLWLARLKLLES